MTSIDIRKEQVDDIDEIIFADNDAYCLIRTGGDIIDIYDISEDYVQIVSKEHALNLIKALEKAIELEWLK